MLAIQEPPLTPVDLHLQSKLKANLIREAIVNQATARIALHETTTTASNSESIEEYARARAAEMEARLTDLIMKKMQ